MCNLCCRASPLSPHDRLRPELPNVIIFRNVLAHGRQLPLRELQCGYFYTGLVQVCYQELRPR
jgi:hypothetical protein